jgi:glycerol-3-phosphate dehydrogenase
VTDDRLAVSRTRSALGDREFDVLVIGGGIHGACAAWDAALRGLKVALVDKGDFGHATSSNSLKTIHGGLRYLQDLDLGLVREMICERAAYMRIAPHLVQPIRCVTPTYGLVRSRRSALFLGAGLLLNDMLSLDRNAGLAAERQLAGGRIVSRSECLRLIPGLRDECITGAAIWSDAQARNTERLTLAFVLGAMATGATACNYMEVERIVSKDGRIEAVEARDTLDATRVPIRARVVVNAAGPWVERVLELARGRRPHPTFELSRAMNLVIPQIVPDYAIAIPSQHRFENGSAVRTRDRLLFVVPWRGYSIVGTTHLPGHADLEARSVAAADVQDFIDELNQAYPPANLTLDDVTMVHSGLLPAEDVGGNSVKLVRRTVVVDHQRQDGIENLVTIVGVKYTAARRAAERAIDVACRKLAVVRACSTKTTPIYGGALDSVEQLVSQAVAETAGCIDGRTVRRLVQNYGSEYRRVVRLCCSSPCLSEDLARGADVSKAEVVHAVRDEMAQKLGDVVFRRTELASAGRPLDEAVRLCATIMGGELGWSSRRIQAEVAEVSSACRIDGPHR